MKYELIVKPSAEIDIWEAVLWHNARRTGLGDEFLLTVEAKFNEIIRNPLQYPLFYRNLRRCFTARFPYGIYFTIDEDEIFVHAVIHTSRDLKILKKFQ